MSTPVEVEPSFFETRHLEGDVVHMASVTCDIEGDEVELVVRGMKFKSARPPFLVFQPRIDDGRSSKRASDAFATVVLDCTEESVDVVVRRIPQDEPAGPRPKRVRLDIMAAE